MSGALKSIEGSVQRKVAVHFSFSNRNLYLIPVKEEFQESLIVPLDKIAVACNDANVQLTFVESDSCYEFSFSTTHMNRNLWNRLSQ